MALSHAQSNDAKMKKVQVPVALAAEKKIAMAYNLTYGLKALLLPPCLFYNHHYFMKY